MNYKLDKEYIVKVVGHNSLSILYYFVHHSNYCVLALPAVEKLGFLYSPGY